MTNTKLFLKRTRQVECSHTATETFYTIIMYSNDRVGVLLFFGIKTYFRVVFFMHYFILCYNYTIDYKLVIHSLRVQAFRNADKYFRVQKLNCVISVNVCHYVK